MKIAVRCAECGFRFKASGKKQGKEVPCPECGRSILVVPRAGLKLLAAGLYFHYAAVPVAILGALAFLLGLAIYLGAVVAGDNEDVAAGGLLLLFLSDVALLAAAAADLPAVCLGFGVPDNAGRFFLGVCLTIRLALFPLGVFFLLSSAHPIAVVAALGVLAAISWGLWVGFVYRLGLHFGRHEIADEAMSLLGSGLMTVLPTAVVIGCVLLVLAIVFGVQSALGKVVLLGALCGILAGMVRAVITGVAKNPLVESPLLTLAYPSGVPFYMKYLSLLGTLRVMIRRP
jgi:DNA-directed RNA polymerase subunit RPC12/RpoP